MSVTRRKPGRLGPFVDGYRVWLLEAGYTPKTVRMMLRDLSRLGRWMDAEDVQIGVLTVAGVELWLAARRAADGYRVPPIRALRALLSYLCEVGVMSEEEPPTLSPVEALIDEYRQWLIADRGLAAMTVLRYETLARRFLTARVTSADELGVAGLDGAVVSRFLLGECNRVCLGSAKGRSRSCGRCSGSCTFAGSRPGRWRSLCRASLDGGTQRSRRRCRRLTSRRCWPTAIGQRLTARGIGRC